MTVYALFIREGEIRDQEEMNAYQAANRANAPDPNVTPLVVYGKQEVMEGEGPDGMVLLKFPTMEAAKAWYFSDGYQAAAEHRKLAADYRVIFVEGF
jgi:uncharacterized protein (DUF1330 family)